MTPWFSAVTPIGLSPLCGVLSCRVCGDSLQRRWETGTQGQMVRVGMRQCQGGWMERRGLDILVGPLNVESRFSLRVEGHRTNHSFSSSSVWPLQEDSNECQRLTGAKKKICFKTLFSWGECRDSGQLKTLCCQPVSWSGRWKEPPGWCLFNWLAFALTDDSWMYVELTKPSK